MLAALRKKLIILKEKQSDNSSNKQSSFQFKKENKMLFWREIHLRQWMESYNLHETENYIYIWVRHGLIVFLQGWQVSARSNDEEVFNNTG